MLKKTVKIGCFDRFRAAIGGLTNSFFINDPTTPDLVVPDALPKAGFLKYAVQGMSTTPKNESERRALNCFMSLGSCINAIQARLKSPLQRWATTNILVVAPEAGVDMNAYYDRRSLKFFYYNFQGKNTYFVDSADIVTHELGHAILDAMRPDFWSVQSLEIWSFHEAFSDIVAVFNLMNYDVVLNKMLSETMGNIRTSNSASRLAEEVGILIRAVTRDPSYLSTALRDPAVEMFRYTNPSSLPAEAPNNQLAAECHSFGRVFSAAWYNAMTRVYDLLVSKGMTRLDALKQARDLCMSVLLKAAQLSPRVSNYYNAVAKCAVAAAKDFGPEYALIFSTVFSEWGIIDPNAVKSLSSTCWSEVVIKLDRGDKVIKTKEGGAIVSMRKKETAKVSELPLISSLSTDPDLEVELPGDLYYEFDPSGALVDEIVPNKTALLRVSADCVRQSLSDDMWERADGRLVRKFIR